MNLFRPGNFTLASGKPSRFKIECDSLGTGDWIALAEMINSRAGRFGDVYSVPRGGIPLANALLHHVTTPRDRFPRLIVDDVWTTGASILNMMEPGDIGWVVFARTPIPERFPVRALFTLAEEPSP
ncbi:MAG: hypothetical protein ACREDM_02895 [Methylocella sp.]